RTDSDVPVASPPIVAWVGRGVDGAKQIGKLAAVAPFLHASGIKLWLAEPHGPEEVERIEPWAVKVLKPLVDFWGCAQETDACFLSTGCGKRRLRAINLNFRRLAARIV